MSWTVLCKFLLKVFIYYTTIMLFCKCRCWQSDGSLAANIKQITLKTFCIKSCTHLNLKHCWHVLFKKGLIDYTKQICSPRLFWHPCLLFVLQDCADHPLISEAVWRQLVIAMLPPLHLQIFQRATAEGRCCCATVRSVQHTVDEAVPPCRAVVCHQLSHDTNMNYLDLVI